MKLGVLAGALALGLGASVLAPVAAHAEDRGRDSRRSRDGATRSYRNDRPQAYHSDAYRSDHSYRSDRSYSSSRSYRSDRGYRSHDSYRSYGYARPYRYRSYAYAYPYYNDYSYYDDYDDGYYNGGYNDRGYYDDAYYHRSYYRPAARIVVAPAYRYRPYRAYRPLLGVRVGGPRFGVWLGF